MGTSLTTMLKEDMLDPYPYPDAVNKVKEIFKEWLKTVSLPQQMSGESTRQLLIVLVDEPE